MKQVIDYQIIRVVNRFGDIRIGYVPIFKDLGPKTNTTMESELPAITPLGVYTNLWPHANTGKERR